MKVIDISAPLVAGIEAWPGDTPFEFRQVARIALGSPVNVGALTSSVHNGTHVDAPLHVIDGEAGVGELPLDAFIGPAVVVDAERAVGLSGPALREEVGRGTRVLLKWGRADHVRFPDEIRAVQPAFIDRLAAIDVPLLGTDQPSVDPVDSKTLDAHRACLRGGMHILENLVLGHVPPGRYELVALPLRLPGADASPVRAVLIDTSAHQEEDTDA